MHQSQIAQPQVTWQSEVVGTQTTLNAQCSHPCPDTHISTCISISTILHISPHTHTDIYMYIGPHSDSEHCQGAGARLEQTNPCPAMSDQGSTTASKTTASKGLIRRGYDALCRRFLAAYAYTTYTHIHTYIYIHTYVYRSDALYLSIYLSMYIYIYIYI